MARQKTIKIKLPILNEALQTCIDRSARFNVIAAGEKAGDTAKPSNGTRANSGTISVEYKIGTAIEAQGKVYTAATMGGKYSTQLSVKNATSGKEKISASQKMVICGLTASKQRMSYRKRTGLRACSNP